MLIWFCFFVVVYLLIYKYDNSISSRQKITFGVLFLITIVYFSAFRDGMGTDYTAYKSYCERDVYRFGSLLGQEPLAALLQSFCYNTNFSAVIFFLVTSTLICTLCTWVYTKYNNAYIALFVFVTYTNLYLASFNLVRQFVAASFILIGAYYFILQKKSPLFFACVFVAFLFHKSAIVFVLIYLLRKSELNPIIWTIIILASWVVDLQPLFNIPFIHDLVVYSDYQSYLSYNEHAYSRFSLSNLYMHAITLALIWNCKKIKDVDNYEHFIFALKLTAISIICSNFSAGSLAFAYRFTNYSSVFIPILFTFLPNLIGRKMIPFVAYIPICLLLWNLLLNGQNDRIYCPQRILPIESIFDNYYKPYDNPDVIIL